MINNDPLRFSSFTAILKALFNIRMLANFQSNRMIGTAFIGLERSMMSFFGKKHHIWIFFLSLPNNVRLISKLYRMHKNKSPTRFWLIRSRVEVYPGSIGENRNFSRHIGYFFRPCPIHPIQRGHMKSKVRPPILIYLK